MKTFLAILIMAASACAYAADEAPALYRMTYGPGFGAGRAENTIVLEGERYTSREALMAAIERIPQRSRILWASGCAAFSEIPLGPQPRMTISEFKAFCSTRLIRFDYRCGYHDPTYRKDFAVSPGLFAPLVREGKSTDLREWFKEKGVSFRLRTFAQWQPVRQVLCVRNTQENVDLIELVLQDAQSKDAKKEPVRLRHQRAIFETVEKILF